MLDWPVIESGLAHDGIKVVVGAAILKLWSYLKRYSLLHILKQKKTNTAYRVELVRNVGLKKIQKISLRMIKSDHAKLVYGDCGFH